MRRRPRLVGLLWHWHRRVGLLAAVFVIALATTGIVLNHSSQLGLDRSFVDWPWLTRMYGYDSVDLSAFRLGEQWAFRAADGRVYLDAQEVAPCSGKLVGAVAVGEMLLAGCAEELLVITRTGALLESVSASTGLPVPLQAIGLIDNRVAVQVDGVWWLADLDQMDFSQRVRAGGATIGQLAADTLPEDIRAQIPAPDHWLSWERLLLDLHSGRLFGRMGVLAADAVGVLLVTLASSGFAMWWLHRRRGHRS
jgi:hypothetical protein